MEESVTYSKRQALARGSIVELCRDHRDGLGGEIFNRLWRARLRNARSCAGYNDCRAGTSGRIGAVGF